jgi:ATP synthase protein I
MVRFAAAGSHVPLLPDASRQTDRRHPADWACVLREAGPLLGIGTSLAITVLLGVLAGRWVDARWGTEPVFTLVGAVLGIGGGLYGFIRTVTATAKKK